MSRWSEQIMFECKGAKARKDMTLPLALRFYVVSQCFLAVHGATAVVLFTPGPAI